MRFPFISPTRKAPPSGARGRLRLKRNPFLTAWRASLDPQQLATADFIIHRKSQNPYYTNSKNHALYTFAYKYAADILRRDCPGPCPSPKRRFFHRR